MHQSTLILASPDPGRAGTVGAFIFQDFGTVECPCNQDMFLNVFMAPLLFKNPPKGKGSETNPTSPVAGQLEKWAPLYLPYIIPACPGLGGGGD